MAAHELAPVSILYFLCSDLVIGQRDYREKNATAESEESKPKKKCDNND